MTDHVPAGPALPLLLASSFAEERPGPEEFPLDRVRMQKGVFLLLMGGPDAWNDMYEFRPYNWGPYSDRLTDHLSALQRARLVRLAPVPGSRYGAYTATDEGEHVALRLWQALTEPERDFVRRVRAYVTGRSFNRLLDEVYGEYPEYATESHYRPWRAT